MNKECIIDFNKGTVDLCDSISLKELCLNKTEECCICLETNLFKDDTTTNLKKMKCCKSFIHSKCLLNVLIMYMEKQKLICPLCRTSCRGDVYFNLNEILYFCHLPEIQTDITKVKNLFIILNRDYLDIQDSDTQQATATTPYPYLYRRPLINIVSTTQNTTQLQIQI